LKKRAILRQLTNYRLLTCDCRPGGQNGAMAEVQMLANGVTNNVGRSRYELVVDGVTAFAEYRLTGNRINFHHTLVPEEIGGRGVGGRLVNAALDDAESRGLEVEATCSFVAKALAKRASTSAQR
jgi:predicted GNAT family acetyltransferase